MKKMDKELIKALIRAMPQDSVLEHYLPEAMEKVEVLIGKIAANRLKVAAENKRHEEAKREIRRELNDLQIHCRHFVTDFQRDPSGGNDHCRECKVCKKVFDSTPLGYDG